MTTAIIVSSHDMIEVLYTVLVHHYFKKNIRGLMPSSVPGVIFFDFLKFFLGQIFWQIFCDISYGIFEL